MFPILARTLVDKVRSATTRMTRIRFFMKMKRTKGRKQLARLAWKLRKGRSEHSEGTLFGILRGGIERVCLQAPFA